MKCLFIGCRKPVAFTVQRLWLVKGQPLPLLHCCADHQPGSRAREVDLQRGPFYRVEPLPQEPCSDCGMPHTAEHSCEPISWGTPQEHQS